jgi:carbohydrate kinase (thermoresistant glucokinase family)
VGASGAGKTTCRRLSEDLDWPFLDGDAVHPPENIAKMCGGTPLTDEDRLPWLQALSQSVAQWIERGINAVLAASLLTPSHRAVVLRHYEAQVRLVYLRVSRVLLRERLTARTGHFAGLPLLESQLALLEEPNHALILDGAQPVEQLVRTILGSLHL